MENTIKAIGEYSFMEITHDLGSKLWSDVRKAYLKENGKPIREEDIGKHVSDILNYITLVSIT
tara:strand:+ start:1343 stop:1531 length:189 start_codon:yes stop_codon:yes gene_type:complete